jgi:hypothetical protein
MELETIAFESEAEWDIEPYPWHGFGFFGKLIAIGLPLLAIGTLILPFLDHSLLRRMTRLPGLGGLVNWLVNSNGSWLAGIALFLLWIGFLVFMRWRIVSDEHQWVDAGCPQCQEREMVRVSRERRDRWYGLLRIPAYRYACRNCTWRGLRIAHRHHHVVLAQEELIAASTLALEAAGLGIKDVPPVRDKALDDRASEPIEAPVAVVEFADAEESVPGQDDRDEAIELIEELAEDDDQPVIDAVTNPANSYPKPEQPPNEDELDWLWRRLSDES